MRFPSFAHLAALGAPLALVACTEAPPSSATIRSHVADDLGAVLHEATAAAQTPVPGASSLALLGAVIPALPLTTTATGGALASLVATGKALAVAGQAPGATGLALDPDATVKLLNEQIFLDANQVGDGIYQVPSALFCTQTTVGPSGQTTQTVNADCVKQLDQVQLRIRVSHDGDRLRFALQLDAQHDEPLAIELGHASIAVTVSFDDAGRALVALAPLVGATAPNVSLKGQVTGELDVLGAAHIKLAARVDRDFAIAAADAGKPLDGPGAFRFASAKAQVYAIELDGGAKTAAFDLGLGATTLAIPAAHPIAIDLPGATAHAVLAAGQPLVLSHVGLGDRTFTVTRDGVRAIAIDLNPDSGRALDATIAAGAAGETLTVSPRLDLRIAVDHAALGDVRGVYDVTRMALDGAIRAAPTSGFAVTAGTFQLVTDPASYGVTAAAGQCVTTATAVDASGKSYARWSAAACP
jgi:hypothetical protein